MTKYIFDFDDVLFFNTEKFKKYMYKCFEDVGVDYDTVKKEELAEKIMKECINFINDELIDKVKQLEVENCYMVTHGVKEYQLEKVHRTGLEALFVDDKEKRFADLDFEKYPNLRKVLYVGPESIDEVFQ